MKQLFVSLTLLSSIICAAQKTDTLVIRDAIGDLNATAVKNGEFPGAIQIPGKNIFVAIGGFIKTIAYYDSRKEQKEDAVLPAYLNPEEKEGQFGISARLSRFLFDARAPTPKGNVRGYFEVDFTNGGFNIRHAYGSWTSGKNEVLAGQYWSAIMDLDAMAYLEAAGDPSLSGGISLRQAQLRYTHKFGSNVKLFTSLEDPSSNDIKTPGNINRFTSLPDLIAGVSFLDPKTGHFQLGGILRELRTDSADFYSGNAYTIGISFGSHLNIGTKGKLILLGSYGKGLGRYLLGLNGIGGMFDAQKGIQLLSNYGFKVAYHQVLTDKFRCNFGFGKAGNADSESNIAFKNSIYANANFLIRITPFTTAGIEYIYGENNFEGGEKGKNHRVQIGVQIF